MPGFKPGTTTPSHLCGPRPPTKSWRTSPTIFNQSTTQDTRSLVISWWSRTGPPPRLCRPSVSSSLVWAQIVGELEPRLDEFAERPATGSSRGGDCRSALGTLVRKQGVGVVHERNVVGLTEVQSRLPRFP